MIPFPPPALPSASRNAISTSNPTYSLMVTLLWLAYWGASLRPRIIGSGG